jgi:hypothetical protein
LIFEVRDATDFKPNIQHEVWWEGMVENQGESAWAGRARRRRGKTVFRLALIPSKTRVGPELEPRVLELALPADEPWTIADVTAEISGAHERSKSQAAEKRQTNEDSAVAALKAVLPIPKSEAEALLTQNGMSRNAARRTIKQRTGTDWILTGRGTKADPIILRSIDGEDSDTAKPHGERGFETPIPAAFGAEGRQESMSKNASAASSSATQNLRRDPPHMSRDGNGGEHLRDLEDLEPK